MTEEIVEYSEHGHLPEPEDYYFEDLECWVENFEAYKNDVLAKQDSITADTAFFGELEEALKTSYNISKGEGHPEAEEVS